MPSFSRTFERIVRQQILVYLTVIGLGLELGLGLGLGLALVFSET